MDYYDIWYDIFSYLDAKSQCILTLSSKVIRECGFPVNDIVTVSQSRAFPKSQIKKLVIHTNLVFSAATLPPYTTFPLTYLKTDISYNLCNVSQISTLQTLIIGEKCGLTADQLRGLNLNHFEITRNDFVKDISFMTNLKTLKIINNYDLTNNCSKLTTLTQLSIKDFSCNLDFTALTNLKKLKLSEMKKLWRVDLQGLDLYELSLNECSVHDFRFMKNLKVLKTCRTNIMPTYPPKLDLVLHKQTGYTNKTKYIYKYKDG